MTKSNSRVRRVKAWNVYVRGEKWDGYMPAGIFQFFESREEARKYQERMSAMSGLDLRISKVLITYAVPTKPKH